MKTFFRTGAYRPPVMSMGSGIARMLLLFVCLLFATLHSDAETVKYGIKINGKEAQWGKKGTGWISNVRGYIEFTLDRMPKKAADRVYRISGTSTEFVGIIVGRDVKDCVFILDNLTLNGYITFLDSDAQFKSSSSVNTNTILISGTNTITNNRESPLGIDGQNRIVINNYSGNDKQNRLILKNTGSDPGISSSYSEGRISNLVIQGGTIEAYGGNGMPGIGSWGEDKDRHRIDITMEGGYVKAVGNNSNGIGGRWAVKTNLKGGTLEAIGSGGNADIGLDRRYQDPTTGNDKLRLWISGGSLKTTNFNQVTPNIGDKKTQTYRVEVPIPLDSIKAMEASHSQFTKYIGNYIKLKNLKVNGADYGDQSLYYDSDGKIYIWLPNGTYEFNAELWTGNTSPFSIYMGYTLQQYATFEYRATVNNNHTTAMLITDFSPSVATMTIPQQVATEIQPTGVPSDYNGTPVYTSSDPSTVSVSGNKLTGLKSGSATITATFPDNGRYRAQTIKFDVEVTFGLIVNDWTVDVNQDQKPKRMGWNYTLENTIVPGVRTMNFTNAVWQRTMGKGLHHSIRGAIYGEILPFKITYAGTRQTVIDFKKFVSKKSYFLASNDVTLYLYGYNELTAFSDTVAGIRVYEGKALTINNDSAGVLTVYGGSNGAAGAGGISGKNAGKIIINGGRIYANGQNGGSGIGGGKGATADTITINGGTVVATHTGDGYDIGSGQGAAATPIIIKGGSVKATSFNGTPTNGSGQQVYRVTIGNLEPNTAVSVVDIEGLDAYGTTDIYSDEQGKIYLWLPNGVYNFKVNNSTYTAAVKDNDGVLMPYHAGTAADPYLISNAEEWDAFALVVNSGKPSAYGKLTDNVGRVKTMAGTDQQPYSGTFDGQGYTLTLGYSNVSNFAAPFSQVSGATIQNLFTGGSIQFTGQFAGGIIGLVKDNPATVTGCGSSAYIYTNTNTGDTSTGGLVGAGVVKMTNCVFNGALAGTGANRGGLIGWANAGTTLTNCLQIGSVDSISTNGSCTFVRGRANSATITNCYYKTALGSVQGTQVTDEQIASGEVAYKLQNGAGTQAWGQQNGYPVLTSDKQYRVYKATFSIFGKEVAASYATGNSTFVTPDVDADIVAMNPDNYDDQNASADVNVELQIFNKDTDGSYLISSVDEWDALVTYYNSIGNFRLTADLNTITTMLGTDAAPFQGTFDGQGHTLNVNITGTSQFTAPFTRVQGATIKDLKVKGTVYQSGSGANVFHASGLVGRADGLTLERCASSVDLSFAVSGDVHSGGLVGHAQSSTINVSDCAFTGSITEPAGNNASIGGIVGWGETTCKVNIKNSYVDLSLTNIPGQNNFVRANSGWSDSGSKFENCYYTVPTGVRDWDPEPSTLVTKQQMQSGEVAYKLQAAHTADGTSVWGQKIGTDADPVLGSSDAVYEVAFQIDGDATKSVGRYANSGGKVSLPTYADFRSVLGSDYDKGQYTQLTITGFDANTAVTGNTTVNCQLNAMGNTIVISSKYIWDMFAAAVAEGQTRINARMIADVSGVTTPVGSKDNPYRGTFDGQGHTLTVALESTTSDELAPFSRIEGATIKNLNVSGTITSNQKYAGSIVGRAYGNSTLSDVASNATLTYTGTNNSDATFGGLIGIVSGATTLLNTAFTGTLTASDGCNVGGLVGWCETSVNISNSLMAGNITVNKAGSSNDGQGNCALARRNDQVTVTNSYARSFNNMQTMQGTQITDAQLKRLRGSRPPGRPDRNSLGPDAVHRRYAAPHLRHSQPGVPRRLRVCGHPQRHPVYPVHQ